MTKHLAVFNADSVDLIFTGIKKIEGRFSKIKIAPFLKVAAGDEVLIKIPGEKIIGQFTVDRVIFYDHPTQDELRQIKKKHLKDLALSEKFWLDHEKINYITLMFIGPVTKFLIPPKIPKKDLRSWVVLDG